MGVKLTKMLEKSEKLARKSQNFTSKSSFTIVQCLKTILWSSDQPEISLEQILLRERQKKHVFGKNMQKFGKGRTPNWKRVVDIGVDTEMDIIFLFWSKR